MAVHIGSIIRATLHSFVTAYGIVEPEPALSNRPPAVAEVASPVSGLVAHSDCVEGQKVAQGTVLFRLDSRLTDIAYDKAKRTLDFASTNFERQKKLLAVEGTSLKDYQEAEQQLNAARNDLAAAQTDLDLLHIKAPLSGTIVKINSKPGETVELNTVLAKIIDLDRLVASVSVPTSEAGLLKIGQAVKFENSKTTGAVVYVGFHVDDKTDTVPVRISIPANAHFKPGQYVSVRILCSEHANCLAVPENAAIPDAVASTSGTIVLVVGDKAVRQRVSIGLREAGLVEITGAGLREGMDIITEDAYAVPDGTRIHPDK
jgi:membrane fusion protein (multidrug efflux system)